MHSKHSLQLDKFTGGGGGECQEKCYSKNLDKHAQNANFLMLLPYRDVFDF